MSVSFYHSNALDRPPKHEDSPDNEEYEYEAKKEGRVRHHFNNLTQRDSCVKDFPDAARESFDYVLARQRIAG